MREPSGMVTQRCGEGLLAVLGLMQPGMRKWRGRTGWKRGGRMGRGGEWRGVERETVLLLSTGSSSGLQKFVEK